MHGNASSCTLLFHQGSLASHWVRGLVGGAAGGWLCGPVELDVDSLGYGDSSSPRPRALVLGGGSRRQSSSNTSATVSAGSRGSAMSSTKTSCRNGNAHREGSSAAGEEASRLRRMARIHPWEGGEARVVPGGWLRAGGRRESGGGGAVVYCAGGSGRRADETPAPYFRALG
jgi:hypothetical protein